MRVPKRTPLPHLRTRRWKDRRGAAHVAYYFEHPRDAEGGRALTALGTDKIKALVEYAKLERTSQDLVGLIPDDFSVESTYQRYIGWAEDRDQSKLAPRTIADRRHYWRELAPVFARCHIDTLTPEMMLRYFDSRSSKVSAKKEIKFLSVMGGWAHSRGWMRIANPVTRDVLRQMKVDERRDVYVTDGLYWLVYGCGDQLVQDTLDFALLSLLRPGEAWKPEWPSVHRVGDEEEIWFPLPKTRRSGVRLKRVRVVGRLKELLERIRARKVVGKTILCDEQGQALNPMGKFRYRFYKARDMAAAKIRALQLDHGDAWLTAHGLPIPPQAAPAGERDNWLKDLIQFRDMRPKAATDSERRDGMPATRKRLGHTTEKQSADYVRDVVGELVDPVSVDLPAWVAKVLSPKTGTA